MPGAPGSGADSVRVVPPQVLVERALDVPDRFGQARDVGADLGKLRGELRVEVGKLPSELRIQCADVAPQQAESCNAAGDNSTDQSPHGDEHVASLTTHARASARLARQRLPMRATTEKPTRTPHPGQLLLAAAAATLTFLLAPAQASATPEPHATSAPPASCVPLQTTGGSSLVLVHCTTASGMNWWLDGLSQNSGGGSETLSWSQTESSVHAGTFSAITGTWVEPVFPPDSQIAIWPGIAGDNLVQAGTASPAWGFPAPYVWAYDYPNPGDSPIGYTGPPIVAGDTITVTLTRLNASSWQVYVSNTTTAGQTYSGTWTENWTAEQAGNAPNAKWMTEINGTVPFPCSVDWLAASATTSTGYVISAIAPLQALMKENPAGFCSTTAPASPPPPPPPPTCDPNSPPIGPVVSLAPDAATGGYWMATPFGEVISCHAPFMGSPASLSAPITAIVATPHGHGYWLVASDGGVFAYGSAQFFGSLPGLPASAEPHSPVVSLVPTATGTGYYEVTANGDVYAFGTAPFYGSMGGVSLAKPVVGAALDPETGGYWLVASDGGVFAFHAPFYGSMGGQYLAKPVVGMSYAPSTGGYRLVASDGGVFSFDAPFHGSMGGQSLAKPVVAIATTPGGYWEVGSDGGVFCFGTAPFEGSLG